MPSFLEQHYRHIMMTAELPVELYAMTQESITSFCILCVHSA